MSTLSKKDYFMKQLKERIALLSRGILPPIMNGKRLNNLSLGSVGVGPQGKKFCILDENGKSISMASVPLFLEEHHLSKYALETTIGEIPGTLVTENGIVLKSVLPPKFMNQRTSDGFIIPIQIHCFNTSVFSMAFKCIHFEDKEPCKYCEIEEVGLKVRNFPDVQSIDYLVESVKIAEASEKLHTISVTSGTFTRDTEDVVKRFIELLKEVKKVTNATIHVQFEPINDTSLLKELSTVADSVGIFFEIFDEKIRKEVCPGKIKTSKEEYIRSWQEAVKYFGRGNVMTSCLLGFGVKFEDILRNLEDFAKIGVRSSLMFVRCMSQQLKDFVPSYLKKNEDELVDLFIEAAKILSKYELDFKRGVSAGCIGCQGCTAMVEASDLVNCEINND